MIFHWSLSDNKYPQVSRTHLSILAHLNNTAVWIVSTCRLIFMFFSAFTKPLVTVQRAPKTIDVTVTFMFHSFCNPKLCLDFSHHRYLMVFHSILSDSKSSQVSRTLLSILTDLNNAVVWMVFLRLLISKSACPFINLLVTVPRAPNYDYYQYITNNIKSNTDTINFILLLLSLYQFFYFRPFSILTVAFKYEFITFFKRVRVH